MAKAELVKQCNTVGDLFDELAAIARDPHLSSVLSSPIESSAEVFIGFRIILRTLSDKSEVLDFVFIGEEG